MSGMPWGGSEELWFQSARQLQQQGHTVSVNYQWWPQAAKQLLELEQHGGFIHLRNQPPRRHAFSWLGAFFPQNQRRRPELIWLQENQPDAALITAGYHPDPIPIAPFCIRRSIPYAINVQCASHAVFLHERRVNMFREAYLGAKKVFFVSEENLDKLETNLAIKLPNAEIICNPFNVAIDAPVSWPEPVREDNEEVFKLACVGRIHFVSKGQDLLVKVLQREKWRDRKLEIHIYGHDQGNERQLRDLIDQAGLNDKIIFGGFSNNLDELWAQHHGLILPSRYEGAALVVVEAMMSHRMAIVTDIGRNRELIDDNETGFIAPAPTPDLLDEAMERAWQARHRWREMGLQAGYHIRQRFSLDPVGDFTTRLLEVAGQSAPNSEPELSPTLGPSV